MQMNRRGFLRVMLAAGAAPAIVKAANIMPIFARKEVGGLLVPDLEIAFDVMEDSRPLLTIDTIAREALRLARERAAFIGTVKMGDTLRIRIPKRYTQTDFASYLQQQKDSA